MPELAAVLGLENVFQIREMLTEDFEFAAELAQRLGWELEISDFEFAMDLEPHGCFVLLDDDKAVGMATSVGYGKLGWFGNLAVTEKVRNKGAGSRLVEHSVGFLRGTGVQTVGLYAYLDRVHFYERLGFTLDSKVLVLNGKGSAGSVEAGVRRAEEQDAKEVGMLDSLCFGAAREKLLNPIIGDMDNLCLVSAESRKVLGYAVAKIHGGRAELGPLGCRSNRADVTASLLRTVLARLDGLEISVFVPERENVVLGLLKPLGFKENFSVARMFLGSPVVGKGVYVAESLERG